MRVSNHDSAQTPADFEILEKKTMQTDPREDCVSAIIGMLTTHRPDQIGISSFGPIDLNRNSYTWGSIMTAASVSKAGWAQYSLAQELAQKIYNRDRSNVFLASDVYGAAIAEYKLANHHAEHALAYVTVGTGIGVGLYIKG
jgi:fructokinase